MIMKGPTGTGMKLMAILALAACAACRPSAARAGTAIDESAVKQALKVLPPAMAAGIREDRKSFDASFALLLAEDPSLLAPVDKKSALAADYVPPDLVTLDGTGLALSKKGLRLREAAFVQLRAMSRAAEKAGITLLVSSTYRDYPYQKKTYEGYVSQLGRAEADRVSARPGHSQHQLGTAVDFGSIDDAFAGTKAGRWLAVNAGAFGFSLSFPPDGETLTGYKYEPWHYRFIAVAGARLQENFFADSQYWLLAFLAEYRR
jgi:D-alanyl-D-alanine carboxypeptidase